MSKELENKSTSAELVVNPVQTQAGNAQIKNGDKRGTTKTLNVTIKTDAGDTNTSNPQKTFNKLAEETAINKRLIEDANSKKRQEDWQEVLKNCGLIHEEYLKYTKNRMYSKLVDIIEYLYKLVVDKNLQIKILSDEYDEMNCLNNDLHNDNKSLNIQNHTLKNKLNGANRSSYINRGEAGINSSMVSF